MSVIQCPVQSRVQLGDPTKSTAKFASFTQECTDIEQITQETLELKAKTCFKGNVSLKEQEEVASYTVCEEGEVHKQQTAVKVVITQGDTDKKELEDKIHLLQ
ncbi:uncharacterized protein [Dysidea avara]|uniref:uncharacterized protein isoform X8 n=1 Tax=Dysidea avara TaxID=196820 RepID=UPI0033318032